MWAHSMNTSGMRHRLVDHLEGTALLAERFAAVFGAGEVGRFAGLAHDVGKASCAWQDGLLRAEATGVRVGEDHKTLGVLLAERRGAFPVLGLPLHGHHGGLTNPSEVRSMIKDRSKPRDVQDRAEAEAALRPLLPGLFDGPPVRLPVGFDEPGTSEMLMRFLFSALVDADGLDTAAHRSGGQPQVAAPADMAMLWDRFVGRRKEMLAGRPPAPAADRLRGEVYEACLAAAAGPTGIYRLPAPTGSGKTIAAAGFGLRHALEQGKSRVIVAVPFITITEQNHAVYRRLLDPVGAGKGAPVVLEHHSNVTVDDDGPAQRWRRLAAENWDAPFVVTTTVQLFDSLFGRKPAAMRKVHRLANSVIVLDEVQALPAPLLLPIVDGLRTLTARFGTTVLLASATQPELWALDPLESITPIEVISNPESLYKTSCRVRYEWWPDPKPTLEQVADRVADPAAAGADQSLTIVNTVANARQMRDLVAARVPATTPVLHLSTAMCPAHRREVLAEVKERLTARLPVRLVSTQLIEAGVDLDFPVVFRAMAPADSLQQAAGRANREGHLGPKGGLVVVFDPADGGRPRSYDLPVGITARYIGLGRADPDDLKALRLYYHSYLQNPRVSGRDSRGAAVQISRAALDFRAVAEGPKRTGEDPRPDRSKAFRMIDEDTVPVAVPYQGEEERVRQLVERIRMVPLPEPRLFRDLQPYLVMIQRRTRDRADVATLCQPVFGDLVEWAGSYDKNTGIVLEPSGEEFIA
ncbi:CRISPR-associated helicase, Cas3 family [Frankia casuarinae]|uniref:CRISPR-associated helicase, Cas3 family n=2 Tax=Frankiaceae TaxID=74712 RepID=Q2J7P4_FRACC|nr:CRISPR-associated helicase/endonuclease Cas3 [Frankia sp. B2]ABD12698.1 CRISPR-associated helicase, Cas3 family [Frankia casuarinae]EYT91143.1 CRISPR-associated helicase, Cas3 family [Frankia casuarinae]KDA41610.1 CRISPR-associated helicase, Cas3 family [Frankia sp. BMG5.23]